MRPLLKSQPPRRGDVEGFAGYSFVLHLNIHLFYKCNTTKLNRIELKFLSRGNTLSKTLEFLARARVRVRVRV